MEAAGFVNGRPQEKESAQTGMCGGRRVGRRCQACTGVVFSSGRSQHPGHQGPPPAPPVEKPGPGSSPSVADPRLLISGAPALKQARSSFLANHDLAQPMARRRCSATMSLRAPNSICNAHRHAHHRQLRALRTGPAVSLRQTLAALSAAACRPRLACHPPALPRARRGCAAKGTHNNTKHGFCCRSAV